MCVIKVNQLKMMMTADRGEVRAATHSVIMNGVPALWRQADRLANHRVLWRKINSSTRDVREVAAIRWPHGEDAR